MDGVIVLTQQDAVELVNMLTMSCLVLSFLGAFAALLLWDLVLMLGEMLGLRGQQKGGR